MQNSSSKFINLYKIQNSKDDVQEKRRQLLLNEQKERRTQLQDSLRGIENFVEKIRHHRKKYKHPSYAEKYDDNYSLQLSEWLKDKPEDLNCWYLVPCPKGKRCLVISSNGWTEVYGKNGKFFEKFHTMLPGDGISRQQNVTILDCIFIEKLSAYFVLDIIAYGNQNFINCETQFRFFWIKSKFSDDSVAEINDFDKFPFIPLSFYDFEDEHAIKSCLSRYPCWNDENLELDGFLFYHKEASYTCGTTPLVGWLFGYMIPEVLQFEVHEDYLKEKPTDYVDYLNYITIFDEKMAKRNNRRKKRRNKMELEENFTEDLIDIDDENNVDEENESNNSFMDILDAEKALELEGRLVDDF